MKRLRLDLDRPVDPFYELLDLLSLEKGEEDREELKRMILDYKTNIVIEVKHRQQGMEKWSEITDFLEEISQKNRHIFIIWG